MNKNLQEGLRWLEQAGRDLKTAELLFQAEMYDVCCFHCQQAAEKALKGVLYSSGLRAILTHSITNLLDECSKHNKSFESLKEMGIEMDRHYIASRYPNFYPEKAPASFYTHNMGETCLKYATLIWNEAQRFLND